MPKPDPEERLAELQALQQEVLGIAERLERKIGELSSRQPGRQTSDDARPRRRPRSVRLIVLDALEDLGWPAYTRELSHYCQARYGRKIPPTRFGTLASDEVRAYQRATRPRSVWLCFGLTHDRGEPIKRLLARSDWPLESRIVAPTTGRVQFLKTTARLCELALEAESTNPEMMKIIAADHARDLPGLDFRRGEFRLASWRDLAVKLLAELEPRDAEQRAEAADRWRGRLKGSQLLFGAPEILDGDGGGQRRRTSG